MASSVHELPEAIVLAREEYRLQIENALQMLLRRIWPYLDELDEQD